MRGEGVPRGWGPKGQGLCPWAFCQAKQRLRFGLYRIQFHIACYLVLVRVLLTQSQM